MGHTSYGNHSKGLLLVMSKAVKMKNLKTKKMMNLKTKKMMKLKIKLKIIDQRRYVTYSMFHT